MVALARAVEQPELLMEHVFTTADEHDAKLFTPMLAMGMDVNFERSHDLSAVIHVERLPDGRIQITAIPLLYGSYAVTRGTGTFSLEPPTELNLAAGWPLFKGGPRHDAEVHYDSYREKLAPSTSSLPIVGLPPAKRPRLPEDALVRVEAAVPMDQEPSGPAVPLRAGRRTRSREGGEDEESGCRSAYAALGHAERRTCPAGSDPLRLTRLTLQSQLRPQHHPG